MNWRLSARVDLRSPQIKAGDARRQHRTAGEILQRFDGQPGQILADEVGMGKTFVALAVAVSVIEATHRMKPVVVMVPPIGRQQMAAGVEEVFERSEARPGDPSDRPLCHVGSRVPQTP